MNQYFDIRLRTCERGSRKMVVPSSLPASGTNFEFISESISNDSGKDLEKNRLRSLPGSGLL